MVPVDAKASVYHVYASVLNLTKVVAGAPRTVRKLTSIAAYVQYDQRNS
jgi:hypothetical protein